MVAWDNLGQAVPTLSARNIYWDVTRILADMAIMPNSKIKIFKIMEKIRESLMQTRNNLATFQFLNNQIASNQINAAPKFFQIARIAVFHETILGIARLTDENQESINFKLLLDMVENHLQLFRDSSIDVRTLVENNRLRLAGLDTFLKGLRSLRDRELAHLDRKQLNDPTSINPEPIRSQNLSYCLDILTTILSDLWQAFNGSPLIADLEEFSIANELDTLWVIIGKSLEKMGHSE
jgi:hypothetical protein